MITHLDKTKTLSENLHRFIQDKKSQGSDNVVLYELVTCMMKLSSSGEIISLLEEMRGKGWVSWRGDLVTQDHRMHVFSKIDIKKFPEGK